MYIIPTINNRGYLLQIIKNISLFSPLFILLYHYYITALLTTQNNQVTISQLNQIINKTMVTRLTESFADSTPLGSAVKKIIKKWYIIITKQQKARSDSAILKIPCIYTKIVSTLFPHHCWPTLNPKISSTFSQKLSFWPCWSVITILSGSLRSVVGFLVRSSP